MTQPRHEKTGEFVKQAGGAFPAPPLIPARPISDPAQPGSRQAPGQNRPVRQAAKAPRPAA